MQPESTYQDAYAASRLAAIVGELSQYLQKMKDNKNGLLLVSDDTRRLMEGWQNIGQNKTHFVCEGDPRSEVYLVDGEETFFNGDAGALLAKILQAMHLSRDNIFICGAASVKEIESRVQKIHPKVIVSLGQKAAETLLKNDAPLEKLCGRFHDFHGVQLMPTYHPSFLLDHPAFKRQVWEDMKQVMAYAGLS